MKSKANETAVPRSLCPINLVLEVIGDNWSLLILRDMMFRGHRSYQAFLRSGEGIATNILADRLVRLEARGLITKTQDPNDARKFVYAPTAQGADLAGLLVEMVLLGSQMTRRPDFPKDVLETIRKSPGSYARRMAQSYKPQKKSRPKRFRTSDVPLALSLLDLMQ